MKNSTRRNLAAVVLPFALLVAACGSDSEGATTDDTATTVAPDDSGSDTTAAPDEGSTEEGPQGEACAAVPTDGEGSVEGMADDPVATAASNNPLLSTLVTAVGAADLGDTLNGLEGATVFAPTNEAFEKIPEEDLTALLEDKEALSAILTQHVIPERIEIDDLSGEYPTANEDQMVTVSGDAPAFDINDGQATAVCSGVQTANATVYLIDSVLMPAG